MAIKQRNVEAVDPKTAEAAAAVESEESRQAAAASPEAAAEPVAEEAAPAAAEETATQATAEQEEAAPAAAADGADVLEEEEEEAPSAAEVGAAAADHSTAAGASAGTAVATATGTTAVAAHGRSGFFQQILDDLAAEGFEGTELDFSSFLNVTLNKSIETSEGHELPNSGFLVRLASARPKYCFRNNNPVEEEVEVAYSYDRNAHLDPESPVYAAIQKWKEEGLDLAPGTDGLKVYQEVMAMMIEDNLEGEEAGTLVGRLITIQVAPTSKGRWAGYLAQLAMNKKKPSDVYTLVRRGKKIESGKFPFFPWDFVNKGEVPTDA